MKICPTCGWADFCRSDCGSTTPAIRYAQRTIWTAELMLLTSANDEQREYWGDQYRKALKILGADTKIIATAA